MGLMDKFKNLFTDEEVIEEEELEPIEIKEIKKEEEVHQLPTFMREKIEKEEQEKERNAFKEESSKVELKVEALNLEDKTVEELPSIKKIEEKKTFKFPIDLTDNDFVETRSRQSIHNKERTEFRNREEGFVQEKRREVPSVKPVKKEQKVSEIYKDKKNDVVEEKRFRATPIISPIYGVLDKNYTPIEVESNKGENLEHHRHSKSVDFDSVRKKAYGTLTEEIKENLMCENCEYLKEAKECKRERQKMEHQRIEHQNLVYDVLEDSSEPEKFQKEPVCDITLDEATENYYDYGVEYEKVPEREEIKIVNHEIEEEVRPPKKEIPPVKSSINLLSTLKKSMGDNVENVPTPKQEKNLELTDDLFNLIDSMYDERNDS